LCALTEAAEALLRVQKIVYGSRVCQALPETLRGPVMHVGCQRYETQRQGRADLPE
jgi:hypothetical protein